MPVFISLEERFARTADGQVWSGRTFSYSFWKRYLDVFEQVRVIARVANLKTRPQSWKRADGEGVTFVALPCYVGPLEYAIQFFSIRATIRKALSRTEAVILRVPSPIAHCVHRELAPGQAFGLEVVGDPYEVFAPGSVKHPMRPFLRRFMTNRLKGQCQEACAVAYVTSGTLQRRYPPRSMAFSTIYSSIELGDDAFLTNPRTFVVQTRAARIVSVGTLEVLYKGFDILIDAVSSCIKAGLQIELVIIGDGRRRLELQKRAQLCGIEQHITFAGRVPAGEAVRNELDRADLFVLASRTEGLPRAMIEAMARGLPCIGSAVGGIPELLAPENLVSPGDTALLARKIREVLSDPDRMARMSAANLARAHDYHDSVLTRRRRQFFTYIREVTQEWNERETCVLPLNRT